MNVASEVGRLRRVVVHAPGAALERMLPTHIHPSHPDYLLFDDLVHVPQAQDEHQQLQDVLGAVAEVHHFDELLLTAMSIDACRKALVPEIARLHRLPDRMLGELEGMPPAALCHALVSGAPGGLDTEALFPPVPNLIFTRDLGAMVGSTWILGNASKPARARESLLTWAITEHHPMFQEVKVSDTSQQIRSSGGSHPLTIEGGDVLVVSNSLVCIGASERTSWSMILTLAEELLTTGFTRILVVEMPKQRSSMHLDTVFTMVDWDRCAVYDPILGPGGPEETHVMRASLKEGNLILERVGGNLLDALAHEGHPLQMVRCGGGHPVHARREQWTDGANYVALGPGIVVGYARNVHTAREMSDAGFRVVDPEHFLRELSRDFQDDPDKLVTSGRRYAVHIEGSELSRGRGGPRCLTLPLERD